MCFGLEAAWLPLLISAGVSAAGSAISSGEDKANAKRVAGARNDVLAHQLNLNTTLGDEARGTFNTRLDQVQPAAIAGQQADVTGQRAASIGSNLPTMTPATFPGAASSSSTTKNAYQTAIDDAVAKSQERATAQANLGGYGDLFFKQGMQDADASRSIATDVNFAKSNAALTPSLQDLAANSAYKPNSGIGAVLQGLGSAFGAYTGSHA